MHGPINIKCYLSFTIQIISALSSFLSNAEFMIEALLYADGGLNVT